MSSSDILLLLFTCLLMFGTGFALGRVIQAQRDVDKIAYCQEQVQLWQEYNRACPRTTPKHQ